MKTTTTILAAVALATSLWVTLGQDQSASPRRGPAQPNEVRGEAPGRPGGERQRPPVPPIIAALDANHDGVIDADEIANAPAALRTLDKNGDGKLTMDELMPPRPDGLRGAGGPDGFRRPPGGPDDQGAPAAEGNTAPRRPGRE